ncbi:hypothetical protein [Mucilaginibacter pallidiroseus]|nr:hypothetical protein [Mucilaginibacter pallidiroseus]
MKRRYALRAYKRVYSKLKRNHEEQAAEILSGIIYQMKITLN